MVMRQAPRHQDMKMTYTEAADIAEVGILVGFANLQPKRLGDFKGYH
jgi:hypothetical protein